MKALLILALAGLLAVPLFAKPDAASEPGGAARTFLGWKITAKHLPEEPEQKAGVPQGEICIAKGKVRFVFGDTVGTCETLHYDRAANAMVLRGDPMVAMGRDLLKGGTLVYRFERKGWVTKGGGCKILLKKDGRAKLPLPAQR